MRFTNPLALAVLAGSLAAQDLNHLDLDNGLDFLQLTPPPTIGLPASGFDPTGDLYWKAFPAQAIRRASGVSPLAGLELHYFDSNPNATQILWAYSVTEGVTGSNGTIVPTFSNGVFVPGISVSGTIFPGSGYTAGWTYSETFVDTATGAPTALIDLTADGTTDWVFTHYEPVPAIPLGTNDLSTQWLPSDDSLGPYGENQPDWTGFGNSAYSGIGVGGSGVFAPIPDPPSRAPDMSLLFFEPTLTVRTDTDNGDGFIGPEIGTAALNTPLQISSGGVVEPGTTTIGVRLNSATADRTGLSVLVAALNVGPTLLDLGLGSVDFLGGELALNPSDPAFGASLPALGLNPFAADADGNVTATSNQIAVGTGAAWHNLELSWQGWELSLVTQTITGSSQVFSNTMRFNDGL